MPAPGLKISFICGNLEYMSKIMVTGGAGFIGSTLVDRLLGLDYQVVVVDNLSTGKAYYLNQAAKFYQADIRSDEIDAIFAQEKPEFVFHLAAQIDVRASMADPLNDSDINLRGSLKILENSRRHGVEKVIFSSTGGAIYGDADELPTTENFPPYPVSFYGIHKLAVEKYLNLYFKVYDLDYAILRFPNVYGPRQYRGGEAGVISIFIDNAVNDRESIQYGDGLQTRDFVYVDDVVEALILAIGTTCQGEINIATGIETSLLELRAVIERVLGRPMKVKIAPENPGEQKHSCLDAGRAKTVLAWQATIGLEEGVRRTIAWAQAQLGK